MKKTTAVMLLAFGISGIARADVFTDEALFQAAAGSSLVVEEFDTFAADTEISSLASLGITFIDQGDGLPAVIANCCGGVPDTAPNVLINRPAPASVTTSTQPFVFRATDFSLISAVALNNIGRDDGLVLRFFDSSGALMESLNIGPGGTPIFGGIVNAAGASTVEIAWDGVNGNGRLGIDGLQVALIGNGSSQPVPEPAPVALLGIGLALIGFARHRRIKKSRIDE